MVVIRKGCNWWKLNTTVKVCYMTDSRKNVCRLKWNDTVIFCRMLIYFFKDVGGNQKFSPSVKLPSAFWETMPKGSQILAVRPIFISFSHFIKIIIRHSSLFSQPSAKNAFSNMNVTIQYRAGKGKITLYTLRIDTILIIPIFSLLCILNYDRVHHLVWL